LAVCSHEKLRKKGKFCMRATTRDWLTFAQKDLVNCERILDDEFLTNIVAFHAQQALEKGFKAIIEEFERCPQILSVCSGYF
jgi:HEPN domain-containing protein